MCVVIVVSLLRLRMGCNHFLKHTFTDRSGCPPSTAAAQCEKPFYWVSWVLCSSFCLFRMRGSEQSATSSLSTRWNKPKKVARFTGNGRRAGRTDSDKKGRPAVPPTQSVVDFCCGRCGSSLCRLDFGRWWCGYGEWIWAPNGTHIITGINMRWLPSDIIGGSDIRKRLIYR